MQTVNSGKLTYKIALVLITLLAATCQSAFGTLHSEGGQNSIPYSLAIRGTLSPSEVANSKSSCHYRPNESRTGYDLTVDLYFGKDARDLCNDRLKSRVAVGYHQTTGGAGLCWTPERRWISSKGICRLEFVVPHPDRVQDILRVVSCLVPYRAVPWECVSFRLLGQRNRYHLN